MTSATDTVKDEVDRKVSEIVVRPYDLVTCDYVCMALRKVLGMSAYTHGFHNVGASFGISNLFPHEAVNGRSNSGGCDISRVL